MSVNIDNIVYTLDATNFTASVSNNTLSTPTDVVIPSTINVSGNIYTVTSTEAGAFLNSQGANFLTSCILPNTITRMNGVRTFRDCITPTKKKNETKM